MVELRRCRYETNRCMASVPPVGGGLPLWGNAESGLEGTRLGWSETRIGSSQPGQVGGGSEDGWLILTKQLKSVFLGALFPPSTYVPIYDRLQSRHRCF